MSKGLWNSLKNPEEREAVKVIVSILGLISTAIAAGTLIVTVIDNYSDRTETRNRLISDRFTKSIELLSSNDENIRVAAIYSLEKIAKESPDD